MAVTVRILNAGGPGVPPLAGPVEEVERALGLPVRLETVTLDLKRVYDSSRRQYHSTALLSQVIDLGGPEGERRIAVVDADLFIPVLTFVFGEAQLNGPAAIVSSFRLQNPYYGLPRDDRLLADRLVKEIVHELGHTLGLYHCRQFECVMRSSTYVEEIDLKRQTFCGDCRALLLEGTGGSTAP